jgi:hypothetical protein
MIESIREDKIFNVQFDLTKGSIYRPFYDPETMAMFARTLEEIAIATENVLHRPAKIRAINIPQHFYDMSSMSTLVVAAENAEFVTGGHQVIAHFNGARLAYNMDNCEGYGFPEDCDIDNYESHESFVAVVDYGKTYFSMGVMAIGSFLSLPIGVRKFPNYGEDAISTVRGQS